MKARQGFTLVELLVVLTIAALLLSIVAPRFFRQADIAREAVLRENLAGLRKAIDQYYADRGQYPERLENLVELRYLRQLPLDPVSERYDSWQTLTMVNDGQLVVYDVRSGAKGSSLDGSRYESW